MNLDMWAKKHNISEEAMTDFRGQMGMLDTRVKGAPKLEGSEAKAQAQEIYEASKMGGRLWRNNVGATEAVIHTKCNKCGNTHKSYVQPVRYGLCNESKKVNEVFKSSDLIGINPVLITPQHVGSVIGQFRSREMKRFDWTFKGDAHEIGQLNWLNLILSLGGDAAFSNGIK